MSTDKKIERNQFITRMPDRYERRRHYVNEADVKMVLSRLPFRYWQRLRKVYFSDDFYNSTLGYTTNRGRREITLCALPDRISLTLVPRIKSPEEFGALVGSQWPTVAVRRFLLYNTFLHEIGHLQVIHEKASQPRRRFADEVKAQAFADSWRSKMWSEPFDHPDPAHNPPGADEVRVLKAGWVEAHLAYKRGYRLEQQKLYEAALVAYERALKFYPEHTLALERHGIVTYEHFERNQESMERVATMLFKALELDPMLPDATCVATYLTLHRKK